MLTDPWFYVVALPAILITGVSKGGFGGGLGMVSVPILSLAILPTTAAAIMLPILCVMDLVGLAAYRGRWHRRNLVILLVGAMTGIGLGAATFRYLDPDAIRILLGVIAVTFTLRHWLRAWSDNRTGRERVATAADPLRGGFWGSVAGFTSFVSHAGSPPVAVYLLPQKLDKTVYHATTVLFFLIVNYVKLLPYALLGQFTTETLSTSAVLFPLAIGGALLGVWLHKRAPDRLFYGVCYVGLFLIGCKLIYDGVAALV